MSPGPRDGIFFNAVFSSNIETDCRYRRIAGWSRALKGCGFQPHRAEDRNKLRHGCKPRPFKANQIERCGLMRRNPQSVCGTLAGGRPIFLTMA
jgi:hypothetical protein